MTRVALVTGASRGIGRHIAIALARSGWDVGVHFVREEGGAQETCRHIEACGRSAKALQADLRRSESISSLINSLKTWIEQVGGRLHTLVNNAGNSTPRPLADVDPEYVDDLFKTNITGPILLTKGILGLIEDGGRIINISSVCARRHFAGHTAYGATKGAVESFTRNLATELAPRSITVNAIAPGPILTERSAWMDSPQGRALVEGLQPLHGVGLPDDVAATVVHLASPGARWLTGEILNVSGGG